MNRKRLLAVLAAFAVAGVIVGLRRDVAAAVVTIRWREPVAVARRFLTLSAAHDSVALAGLSVGPAPVDWALDFGRQLGPTPVTARAVAGWGAASDTVRLVFRTSARWCPAPDEPSNLQFVLVRVAGEWRVSYAGAEPC